ncbi:MAG: NAD-dependent epimerase/dehydratase family protein [Gemmataceae bacterium]
MKSLVTGSSGHLGEGLVRTLQTRGDDVVGLDILHSRFTDVVGSITDRDCVKQCMVGVDTVFHTATLHKPHLVTHTMQDFIDTNMTGTLVLLEEAVRAGVARFIFTSTTSVFGDAMRPAEGVPTVWVTEDLRPIPRNIYGVTKNAAEDICQLFHKRHGLPCLVVRTPGFFREHDDDPTMRLACTDGNIKANEFLYRRADLEDVVQAHLLAVEKAETVGFDRFIISATAPFRPEDCLELSQDAPSVLKRRVPAYESVYEQLGWKMFPRLDRVYVNAKAREVLGWRPQYDFRYVIECLHAGTNPKSQLSRDVGVKGYHGEKFENGPYPVE